MHGYGRCPRCGSWTMEHLETHSHCWECNYFPDDDCWLTQFCQIEHSMSKISAQRRAEDERVLRGTNHSHDDLLASRHLLGGIK